MAEGRNRPNAKLTPREQDVLELMRVGLNDDQIATQLDISPAGVRFYVGEVIAKLGVSSRQAAAAWKPPEEPTTWQKVAAALRRPRAPRLTRLRAFVLLALGIVAALYVWGIFFPAEEEAPRTGVSVQWLAVDPPPVDLRESARPYAGMTAAGAEDIWRVYVADLGGSPRLLHETRRRAGTSVFLDDGSAVITAFSSQTGLGETVTGFVALDPRDGSVLWERVFSSSAGARVSRDSGRIALTGTPRVAASRQVYILDGDGASRQLVSKLLYGSLGSWSPDGRLLLVGAFVSGETSSRFYALAPYEDEAVDLGFYRATPSWSPDGRRVAGFEGNDLVIFELESRSAKRAPLGQRVEGATAGQLSGGLVWSNDGAYVSAAGTVVEAATGRIVHQQPVEVVFTSASPDGRWVAASTTGVPCGGTSRVSTRSPASPNKTFATDMSGGRTLELLGCGDGFFTAQRWLSPSALLLSGTPCTTGCTVPPTAVLLASLPDGRVRSLTDAGGEVLASAAPSPDGERVLVGGRALRLYSGRGDLLRTIEAPPGMYVTGLSWAADGRTFAYVVGPRVVSSTP